MKHKWRDLDKPDSAGKRRTQCQRCGITLKAHEFPYDKIRGRCPLPGWGDFFAHFLAIGFGIDKARFTAFLRRVGLIAPTKTCGCPKRQEALNEAGWEMESWAKRVYAWLRR